MNIQKQLLKSNHKCRPGGNYKKLSITIHSTANPTSTAQNERAWLDNTSNNRLASWHYVVGEGVVIQAIPDAEESWHAGNTEGNRYSIGIEIVESGDRKNILETAAEFVAAKLREHNLSIGTVKQHYDWTKKNCPRILIDKACIKDGMDWNYFIGRVDKYLKNVDKGENVVDKGDSIVDNAVDKAVDKKKRYQTLAELPEWAQPTIQKLVDTGKIADGNKLDLSMDMVRILVIIER